MEFAGRIIELVNDYLVFLKIGISWVFLKVIKIMFLIDQIDFFPTTLYFFRVNLDFLAKENILKLVSFEFFAYMS